MHQRHSLAFSLFKSYHTYILSFWWVSESSARLLFLSKPFFKCNQNKNLVQLPPLLSLADWFFSNDFIPPLVFWVAFNSTSIFLSNPFFAFFCFLIWNLIFNLIAYLLSIYLLTYVTLIVPSTFDSMYGVDLNDLFGDLK